MQAIKAVYDGTSFTPTQPIPVQGNYEVVITFIEQITLDDISKSETENTDLEYWQEFKKLAENSRDEVLSFDDFPRTKFNREFILFDEEQAT